MRALTDLSAWPVDGPQFMVDKFGVGATNYPYQILPYTLGTDNRPIEAPKLSAVQEITYPVLPAVEYLSGLPNLNAMDNSVTLQWSHFNDKVASYEVLRNGIPVSIVSAGDSLVYVDKQGKPDQSYIYQVRAVQVSNEGIFYSENRSVEVVFPEVARPIPLTATAWPDSNAVRLDWSYNGDAVRAFRLFRNGIPVADLPKDRYTYTDYEGIPLSDPTYSIIALLEREGMQFQSRATNTTITFPPLKIPHEVLATENNDLGIVELSFKYQAPGVQQFEIYRKEDAEEVLIGTLPFEYDKSEQTFSFVDDSGFAEQNIVYEVVAVSERSGLRLESMPGMSEMIDTFPAPPAVTFFQGSTGFSHWVDLNWQLDLNANIDGFVIFREYDSNNFTYEDALFIFPSLSFLHLIWSIPFVLSAKKGITGSFQKAEKP